MTDSEIAGAAGSNGDADRAARGFRSSLDRLRGADDVLADALSTRRRATAEAAELVRRAEAQAALIVAEARAEAARITAAVQAGHADAVVDRLETMASDVQMALDTALAEIAKSLGPLTAPTNHASPDDDGDDQRGPAGEDVPIGERALRDRWRELLRPR